jgi:hypothetical protein
MLEMIRVQIVKLLRIDLYQGARKEISLFLVVSLEHNLSPLTMRVSRASITFALGRTGPFIQGWTSCMRRRFSSRRVVQERDARANVCCAIALVISA